MAEIIALGCSAANSPTVGRSGSASERFAVFTASARSLPSLMYSIDEDRSGHWWTFQKRLLADIGVPRFAERDLWNIARDRLHWLDVGRHNHLAPFLGFVGDEFAEISAGCPAVDALVVPHSCSHCFERSI